MARAAFFQALPFTFCHLNRAVSAGILLNLRFRLPHFLKTMAFKRTYKFSWLDHLYYTGKGGPAVWSMWFYIECFFVLPPLILLLLCTVVMVREQAVNTVLVILSICVACALAAILLSKRLLEKLRFTPQRERAYFRRYPGRKYYSYPFFIVIIAFLTNSIFAGFLVFYILKWLASSDI